MGLYLCSNLSTKERLPWISERAEKISRKDFLNFDPNSDYCVVCYYDQGAFQGLAIGFDERERQEFTRIDDHRPKMFFRLPLKYLKEGGVSIKSYESYKGP